MNEQVHLHTEEQQCEFNKNLGWCFWDEIYVCHGPFNVKEEAERKYNEYCNEIIYGPFLTCAQLRNEYKIEECCDECHKTKLMITYAVPNKGRARVCCKFDKIFKNLEILKDM